MDRRATLSLLFGKSQDAGKANAAFVASGLDPYTGPFDFDKAAHLLRRAMFGPNQAQIKQAVDEGLNATVARLLADKPMPDPPVNYYYANDPYVPIGESWVKKGYVRNDPNLGSIRTSRFRSLYAWTLEQLLTEGVHIREKMTLFWHNHYVTSDNGEPIYLWEYIHTLRQNALGNFKDLTKKMTLDPAMLNYLNGNQNRKNSPNENYARELLELFSIGKGPLVRFGDYTNYTEDDIKEAAKVLTGFITRFSNLYNENFIHPTEFIPSYHDTSEKILSYRFNYAQIGNENEFEHETLVDIIFRKRECARYLCRKLYRWFVYYTITPEVEQDVIEPMAQILVSGNYEVKPVLQALFKSQHFFDILNQGPMIKNPIDFVVSGMKAFGFQDRLSGKSLNQKYNLLYSLYNRDLQFQQMQMVYFFPPDVAGWKAYYQEPGYYRVWINSATLPSRKNVMEYLIFAANSRGVPLPDYRLDVLSMTASFDNALDPNSLIDQVSRLLFPQPLTEEQKNYLKEVLIPGLPDFEWTIEYGDYLAHPDDKDLQNSVEAKLRNFYNAVFSMPEYYLS